MKIHDLLELQQWLGEMVCFLQLEVKAQKNRAISDKFTQMHEVDLVRAHKLVSLMLLKLESQVINQDAEEFKYLFGEKESAISVLTKLSSMLLKFIPMEQEFIGDDVTDDEGDISQQDAEFLAQYVAKSIKNSAD